MVEGDRPESGKEVKKRYHEHREGENKLALLGPLVCH
jgi:hypothetical protein